MKKIGEFRLRIELFQEDDSNFIPIFKGVNINMPKEVLLAQLKSFLKTAEDDYHKDFRSDISTLSGKPE